jgi:hypothetical protein
MTATCSQCDRPATCRMEFINFNGATTDSWPLCEDHTQHEKWSVNAGLYASTRLTALDGAPR